MGCVLLQTWISPPPTDMMGAVKYYQNIKVVNAFWTWQHFLITNDYMTLFPEAYASVDVKIKAFYSLSETYSCWHAFNEWHVAKMMGIATLTEATSDLAKATLASFFWDETFISTVKTLLGMKMWSWSYPEAKWLTASQPFIALSLPWIAFMESYWESTIAGLQETALKVTTVKATAVKATAVKSTVVMEAAKHAA